jgi:hypothetical protein
MSPRCAARRRPRPGKQIPLRGGPVIEIIEVAEPAVHLVTAIEFYGPGINALQLLQATGRGRRDTAVSGAVSRSSGVRASLVSAA